ncbi:MAG: tRNA (adenosine(37)-N6)-threonylcarbamoyltransferase complex dimerization subunit type 1 TsaB [Pirellulaceae bacterium]|jgi:tRNA threonylcarbamoyladenosine biosynthesis protein TsaB|nr:tRNA (adenosine(37)-N6)-threonylcarbamoyltransferase complex dimerization subunit type 1 TsaB [Pirellulaceae bacterium]
MLHLAIECSAQAGSVAILQQQAVIAESLLPPHVGSVVSMAPTIAELLAQYGAGSSAQVELISVTHGPGSFTGLRAGLATAKMLGLAWQIPLVAVDTLQIIAARSAENVLENYCETAEELGTEADQPIVVAVLNAFRKQVFAAAWRIPAGHPNDGSQERDALHDSGLAMIPLAKAQVLGAPLWQAQPLSALSASLQKLNSRQNSLASKRIWVSGPGLRSYTPRVDSGVHLIDESHWDPVASWVGRLGWQHYMAGQAVSAAGLSPNYVRASAAEEARTASAT